MTNRSVEQLSQILGSYFDEDWRAEHREAEGCLIRMLREVPAEDQRLAASEIRQLLDGTLCENQIRDVLLYEVGCRYLYDRDGYDASSWLRHVHDRIVERWTERS